MKATVTVISGSLQGQTNNVSDRGFRIGGASDANIAFDPRQDSGAKDQLVLLSFVAERWCLQNQGSRAIFVNHDLVTEGTNLRSGDLIRLSHDGPDLLFELGTTASNNRFYPDSDTNGGKEPESVHRDSPRTATTANAADSIYSDREADETTVEGQEFNDLPLVSSDAPRSLPSVKKASNKRGRKLGSKLSPIIGVLSIVMGGIAGICVAVLLLWVIWRKDPLGMIDVVEALPAVESPANERSDDPRMAFSDVEQRLGGESVSANRAIPLQSTIPRSNDSGSNNSGSNDLSQSTEMRRSSSSVNAPVAPPQMKKIGEREFDLSLESILEVRLYDCLISHPTENFTFRLSESSPEGVTLDQETGFLRWEVPESFAGKEVHLSFTVAQKNHADAFANGVVVVKPFFSDSWDLLGHQIAPSAYLLVTKAEPGDRFLALGTGCAIDSNLLLTSATVAQGVSNARTRGWDVFAVCHAQLANDAIQKIEIGQQRFHRMYLDASNKADSTIRRTQEAFFDLALIETKQSLGSLLRIGLLRGGEQDAASVGCFGYSINGALAMNLQELRPEFTQLALLGTFPPENASLDQGRPPLLLELEGEMPVHTFGGLLINSTMELVGIYGFEGASDVVSEDLKQPDLPVHFASELLTVKLFLNDQGIDLWIPQ